MCQPCVTTSIMLYTNCHRLMLVTRNKNSMGNKGQRSTKSFPFLVCVRPSSTDCMCAVSELWVFDGDAFIFCHPFAISQDLAMVCQCTFLPTVVLLQQLLGWSLETKKERHQSNWMGHSLVETHSEQKKKLCVVALPG